MEQLTAIRASKLESLFSRMRKSSFVKNMLIVMSGTAMAQAISVALTPIISRFFSPADFGVSGSFSAVLGIVASGVTLDYTQAIMLPKEKGDAINLFSLSCLCTFIVAFMLLIVCLIIPSSVNGVMKTNGIWPLALLVVATAVSGINHSCQAWCIRVKAFKHTAATQVVRSFSEKGAKIGFGFFNGGAAGLIVSGVLGNVLASFNLVRVLLRDILNLRPNIQWHRMKQLAKEYRDFPMYSASQNVINAVSSGLPVLLLTKFFGIGVAGAYVFGMYVLESPMGFILTPLRQVLFQKAAETQHQGGSLISLYVRVSIGLFAIALLPSVVLFIWAPQIFGWVFGSQWHLAGDFARSLVIWTMFIFCNLPAVLFARLIRIQRRVFFYDLFLLAMRLSSLVLGGLFLSAGHTIIVFSVVGGTMNLFLILMVGHAILKKEGHVNWEDIRDLLTPPSSSVEVS